jgi:hypothetical protein
MKNSKRKGTQSINASSVNLLSPESIKMSSKRDNNNLNFNVTVKIDESFDTQNKKTQNKEVDKVIENYI